MMFDGFGSSAQHIRAGRIVALAVAADRKCRGDPDDTDDRGRRAGQPTAPRPGTGSGRRAGRPRSRSIRWSRRWRRSSPRRRSGTDGTALGAEVPTTTGRAFGEFVDAEIQRWDKVVRTANVKLEG